jgi:hypothetical protein
VLIARGMVAFLRVAGSLAAASAPRTPAPAAARAAEVVLDVEVIRVWSRMVFVHEHVP